MTISTKNKSIGAGRPYGGREDWAHPDSRLDRLIGRLPAKVETRIRWLLRPGQRWLRIPAGLLLILGGLLSILPVLGLWMLPLGLALLAEDVALLRRARGRTLDWVERRWPQWVR